MIQAYTAVIPTRAVLYELVMYTPSQITRELGLRALLMVDSAARVFSIATMILQYYNTIIP